MGQFEKGAGCMHAQEVLRQWIAETDNLVFFGGAGVSTESGIPDFRSADGLYNETYDYPPERIVSHTFFVQHTADFYRFYRDRMLYPDAKPNAAHRKVAQWEREGKCRAVVTQNIDGLHQAAGSRNVLELHGSVHRNYCQSCGKFYDLAAILAMDGVPYCACGGIIKPDVVLYEEQLDGEMIERAVEAIAQADVLLVAGTSLSVYPAAGLVNYYRGHKLVLINKSPTPYDKKADLLLQDSVGKVLDQIV